MKNKEVSYICDPVSTMWFYVHCTAFPYKVQLSSKSQHHYVAKILLLGKDTQEAVSEKAMAKTDGGGEEIQAQELLEKFYKSSRIYNSVVVEVLTTLRKTI